MQKYYLMNVDKANKPNISHVAEHYGITRDHKGVWHGSSLKIYEKGRNVVVESKHIGDLLDDWNLPVISDLLESLDCKSLKSKQSHYNCQHLKYMLDLLNV